MLAATRRLCEEERVGRLIPLAKRSFPVGMEPATRVMPVAIRIVPRRGSPPTRVMPLAREFFHVVEVLRLAPLRKPPRRGLQNKPFASRLTFLIFAQGSWLKAQSPGQRPPSKPLRVEGLRGRGLRSAGTGSWRGSGGNHFHQWLIHQHIYIGKSLGVDRVVGQPENNFPFGAVNSLAGIFGNWGLGAAPPALSHEL